MKKIIHFIRHGQTKYNFEKKIQGSIDIPLSNIGIQQTKNFEDRYFLEKYDVAYYSSLSRTKQTFDILMDKLKNKPDKIIMTDLIKERSYGILEGLNDIELQIKYPNIFKKWKIDDNFPIPDAEPIEVVIDRVLDFVDIVVESSDTNVLAITHPGVLYALYKYINDIDLSVKPQDVYFYNCCSVYLNIYIDNNRIIKYEFKFGDKTYVLKN